MQPVSLPGRDGPHS
jgi:hypothetical protein